MDGVGPASVHEGLHRLLNFRPSDHVVDLGQNRLQLLVVPRVLSQDLCVEGVSQSSKFTFTGSPSRPHRGTATPQQGPSRKVGKNARPSSGMFETRSTSARCRTQTTPAIGAAGTPNKEGSTEHSELNSKPAVRGQVRGWFHTGLADHVFDLQHHVVSAEVKAEACHGIASVSQYGSATDGSLSGTFPPSVATSQRGASEARGMNGPQTPTALGRLWP